MGWCSRDHRRRRSTPLRIRRDTGYCLMDTHRLPGRHHVLRRRVVEFGARYRPAGTHDEAVEPSPCTGHHTGRRHSYRRCRPSSFCSVGILGGNWFERLEDDFGLKRREIEFASRNAVVDRPVDVLEGVLKGDRKAVEPMSLDVDVDVLVFVSSGDSSDQRWRNRLRFAIRRERE